MFERMPVRKKVEKEDDPSCQIKIRHTANGKEIKFSGKCSREQIEIAKENINQEPREQND